MPQQLARRIGFRAVDRPVFTEHCESTGMKRNSLVVFTTTLFSTAVFAAETNSWTYDLSFYGLAAGMSGKTGIGPVNADIDVGFDKIWDHLKLAGMGTARVGYGRWAISTDVIYMGLEGEKNQVTSKVGQWMVQPVLEYEICRYFGLYAGTRYNNIHLEIDGPFQRNPSATHDWWTPSSVPASRHPSGVHSALA